MKIAVSKIQPSPEPVRKSMEPAKLDELAQSIKEQGLIAPIKVRPNGTGYEIVYGHRRFAAAQMAGLQEIEAIVEGLDDLESHRHALTENKVREDMHPIDIAKALQWELDTTGLTKEQVGKRYGLSRQSVTNYLTLLQSEFVSMAERQPDVITQEHVMQAKAGSQSSEDAALILEKTGKEKLSKRQTRRVADAYRSAPTPEEKQAILETPIDNPYFDRIVSAKASVKKQAQKQSDQTKRQQQQRTQEVANYLEAIKVFLKAVDDALIAVGNNRFSPEAARFTIRKTDLLYSVMGELEELLNEVGNG